MPYSKKPFVAIVLGLALVAPGIAQEEAPLVLGPELEAVAPPPPLRLAESVRLNAFVELSAATVGAIDQIEALTQWNAAGQLPTRVGFVRPVPTPVHLRLASEYSSGVPGRARLSESFILGDGSTVWGTSVYVQDAHRLRLRLENVNVPEGSIFWVWGEADAPQAFGLELLAPEGHIWTPSVQGPTIYLEVALPPSAQPSMEGTAFTVDEVAQIFELDADGAPRLGPGDHATNEVTSCLIDAACVTDSSFPNISLIKKAVSRMQFVIGGNVAACTGTLLNNTRSDGTPYFLTANHCLSTQTVASTLETFWDYIATSCGGSWPNPSSLPKVTGATLLATSTATDFSFLRLSALPAGRVLLGWTSSAVGSGPTVYRLHHPHGWPMSYSSSVATANSGCGFSSSNFLLSDPAPEQGKGQTFPGSSGSSTFNSAGQVVGQLFGGCAADPDEPCLFGPGDHIVDGRLSVTYPSIAQYLSPAGGGDTSPCVSSATTACFQNGRFEAKVTWTTISGTGSANIMSFGGQRATTEETAFFQFFSPTNFEMGLKVLNACIDLFNNKYWIFISGLTDQGWAVRIRDTRTGQVQTYTNNLGTLSTTFRDQTSFNCN